MTTRLLTSADASTTVALAALVRDELVADWGAGAAQVGSASFLADLADANKRWVGSFDAGLTLRGAALFRLDTLVSAWQLVLVFTDKTLSANQRLTHFRDAMKDIAGRVPAVTKFYGVTKVGGRLDTYLSTTVMTRTLLQNNTVRFDSTAAQMLLVL